eukprot:4935019-Pleurochrysis_carterae.AAC.1
MWVRVYLCLLFVLVNSSVFVPVAVSLSVAVSARSTCFVDRAHAHVRIFLSAEGARISKHVSACVCASGARARVPANACACVARASVRVRAQASASDYEAMTEDNDFATRLQTISARSFSEDEAKAAAHAPSPSPLPSPSPQILLSALRLSSVSPARPLCHPLPLHQLLQIVCAHRFRRSITPFTHARTHEPIRTDAKTRPTALSHALTPTARRRLFVLGAGSRVAVPLLLQGQLQQDHHQAAQAGAPRAQPSPLLMPCA